MSAPAMYSDWSSGDFWRLLIVHRTELAYPETVATSYNEVRMQPLEEMGQSVLSSRLEIDPFEGMVNYVDYFGTRVAAFDVHRPHRRLTITSTTTVETFTPEVPREHLGWAEIADPRIGDRFEEFLSPTRLTEPTDDLVGLAEEIREQAATPADAGRLVADLLLRNLKYEQGATGVRTSADEAWQEKRGVCQDFSHLACVLLRSLGVPARYVSGYLHPEPDAEIGQAVVGQSHAWVEWFDGAWTPFDPTNGAVPGHEHVIVGRGRDYGDVPPMKGVYAGPEASGNDVTVRVTRLR